MTGACPFDRGIPAKVNEAIRRSGGKVRNAGSCVAKRHTWADPGGQAPSCMFRRMASGPRALAARPPPDPPRVRPRGGSRPCQGDHAVPPRGLEDTRGASPELRGGARPDAGRLRLDRNAGGAREVRRRPVRRLRQGVHARAAAQPHPVAPRGSPWAPLDRDGRGRPHGSGGGALPDVRPDRRPVRATSSGRSPRTPRGRSGSGPTPASRAGTRGPSRPGEPRTGFPAAVRSLVVDPAGTLWAGTAQGLIRRSGKRFVPAGLTDAVLSLHAAADGTILAGTPHGLRRPPGGRVEALGPADGLPGEVVNCALRDRRGTLWIGTSGGLARRAAGRLSVFTPAQGLSNGNVLALLEDREGTLWVGTQDGGLNKLSDASFTPWGVREGLSADVAWAVFVDRDGAVWSGTDSAGVNVRRGDRVTTIGTADGLAAPGVQAIWQHPDGSVWLGTRGGGVSIVRGGKVVQDDPQGRRPRERFDLRHRGDAGRKRLPRGARRRADAPVAGRPLHPLLGEGRPPERDGPRPPRGPQGQPLDRDERRRPLPVRRGALHPLRAGPGALDRDRQHDPRGDRRDALDRDLRRRPEPLQGRPLQRRPRRARGSSTTRSSPSSRTGRGTSGSPATGGSTPSPSASSTPSPAAPSVA